MAQETQTGALYKSFNPEGWGGEGDGREFQKGGDICIPMADSGRDWGQEEKGTTEDEMAGWHHQLDGHEFE